jgi:hypothetical protein
VPENTQSTHLLAPLSRVFLYRVMRAPIAFSHRLAYLYQRLVYMAHVRVRTSAVCFFEPHLFDHQSEKKTFSWQYRMGYVIGFSPTDECVWVETCDEQEVYPIYLSQIACFSPVTNHRAFVSYKQKEAFVEEAIQVATRYVGMEHVLDAPTHVRTIYDALFSMKDTLFEDPLSAQNHIQTCVAKRHLHSHGAMHHVFVTIACQYMGMHAFVQHTMESFVPKSALSEGIPLSACETLLALEPTHPH